MSGGLPGRDPTGSSSPPWRRGLPGARGRPFRTGALGLLGVIWAACLGGPLVGCGDSPGPHELRGPDLVLPPGEPPPRPSDGLLDSPELQALVEAQIRREVGPLLRGLTSPDPAVRARSALAMGSVQDPDGLQALLTALEDSDPGVRRDAAFALGQIGGFGVGSSLLSALESESDPEVVRRLLEAVGKVGDEEELARLVREHSDGAYPADVGLAVGRFGLRSVHDPAAQRWLAASLTSEDPGIRYASSYYFSRVADPTAWSPVLPDLRAALAGLPPDDPSAIHLLQALARVGDPTDHPLILPFLRTSTDWRVRVEAAQALAHPGPSPEVRGALLDALDDPVVNVARAAAQSFGGVRTPPSGDLQAVRKWVRGRDGPEGEWQVAEPLLALLARSGEDDAVMDWLDSRPANDVDGQVVGLRALSSSLRPDALSDLARWAAEAPSEQVAVVAAELIATRRWSLERAREESHPRFVEVLSGLLDDPRVADALPSVATALADERLQDLGGRERVRIALDRELATDGGTRDSPGETGGASDRRGNRDQRALALAYALAVAGDSTVVSVLLAGVTAPDLRSRFLARGGLAELGIETELPPRPTPSLDWWRLARLGRHPTLVVMTGRGEIRFRLDAEAAPQTVQTLTALAESGRFDGVPFHRVENDFVIQGGDLTRGTSGEPADFVLRSEFNTLTYLRGTLGMASAGKDTETSQFFVTHLMTPHLDGRYTVFGWVEDGMDVVDAVRQEDRIIRTAVIPDPAVLPDSGVVP